MLKSTSAISTAWAAMTLIASSALAASISSHSGPSRRKALAITMRASLLSSTIRALYCISRLLAELAPRRTRGRQLVWMSYRADCRNVNRFDRWNPFSEPRRPCKIIQISQGVRRHPALDPDVTAGANQLRPRRQDHLQDCGMKVGALPPLQTSGRRRLQELQQRLGFFHRALAVQHDRR